MDYNMDKPWGHSEKWNKPVTKGQILHDSMRHLKLSNSQKQRVEWQFQGLEKEGKGKLLINVYEIPVKQCE